ncbi:MAG: hypothetical protein NEA02_13700 [Thermoanaerobaculia bacterium]|nr:hypothetical protein [Thermoanaerobaculia bacterium]
MQILTYPFGVLVGTLTIAVDLGSTPPPAELRFDGRMVCALAQKLSSCEVDLGPAPRIHVVEAVRLDPSGRVVERSARNINVPGTAAAEGRLLPECSAEKKTCVVRFGWLHPQKKPLVSAKLSVDGAEKEIPRDGRVVVPYDPVRGHVLSVELDFGGDDRTVFSEVVGLTLRAETSTALRATPVSFDGEPQELEKRLRSRGLTIQTVERGDAEVTFVVEMTALGALSSVASRKTLFLTQRLATPSIITVVPANAPDGSVFPRYATLSVPDSSTREARPMIDSSMGRRRGGGDTAPDMPDWMLNLLARLRGHLSKSPRASDAVAAAGFSLGASPRRRALVLVLGDQADESRFTPEAVRAYLKEIAVPLVVLRMDAPRPAWPEAVPVKNVGELARAFSDVRTLLAGQAVVWAPPETSPADLLAP